MAESAAQKRSKKLHEAIVASRARRQLSARDEATIEKMVAPSPQPTAETKSEEVVATAKEEVSDESMRTRHFTGKNPSESVVAARQQAKASGSAQRIKVPTPNKDHKTYQRHVLFAVVSAFLIQLVANNKSLPTKS